MVKVNRAIVYRLYPNKKQEEQFQKTFGCVRFVYNQILSLQKERYEYRRLGYRLRKDRTKEKENEVTE